MANKFVRLSSRFYKLERYNSDAKEYEVYEFHRAVNGFMYYKYLIENENHEWYTTIKTYDFGKGNEAKELGNKKYAELKNQGFEFVGVYKMDVLGNKEKIK